MTANAVVKTAVTVAALGATAYSGLLGTRIGRSGRVPAASATESAQNTPDDVAAAQRQQRVLQWVIPALTGTMVALGAQQGEQQRPRQVWGGVAGRLSRLVGH